MKVCKGFSDLTHNLQLVRMLIAAAVASAATAAASAAAGVALADDFS